MNNLFTGTILFLLFSFITSCDNDEPDLDTGKNPFELQFGWNGFIFNGEEHSTPNAYIEIFGENLDSLSSNFDISFTDGTFDDYSRSISGHKALVYFDVNSPDLEDLKPGAYEIENTVARKPGNIVEAFILFPKGNKTIKYPIFRGEVTVSKQNNFYLVQYELHTVVNKKEIKVNGQYSGIFAIKDYTSSQ